jgi:hypothetical protein
MSPARELTKAELVATVLSLFTSGELHALAERRGDAERRHGDEVAAGMAESFWTEVEADPDTMAAFERIAAEMDRSRSHPPRRRARSDGAIERYGAAALEAELQTLAGAELGERNVRVNTAAFRLGQLVAAGHVEPERVAGELLEVGRSLGLRDAELVPTIRSGMAAGMQRPRP